MPLETATYINQLDTANPLASDPIAAGDDHLRLIKATVKATFPNITGPVTLTQAQINDGLQKAGGTMTGALVLSGAPTVDLNPATKKYVDDADALKAVKTTTITAGAGLTGGGDLSANRSIALATTGVTAGSYGSATNVPVITVNDKGQITSASTAAIVPFAWNTTYTDVDISSGGSWAVPSNCIGVYIWCRVYGGGNNGGIGRAQIKNSGGSVIGTMYINGTNISGGADGGSGMHDGAGSFIPLSSAASSVALDVFSNGVDGSFKIQAYVTKA